LIDSPDGLGTVKVAGRIAVIDPTTEMRRWVGKLAFLFSGVYVILLFAGVAAAATGNGLPVLAWPPLLVPGAAFAAAVVDGFRLHRTADATVMATLWRRCLLYLVIGVALFAVSAVMVERFARA
jgi:hypothetical protein